MDLQSVIQSEVSQTEKTKYIKMVHPREWIINVWKNQYCKVKKVF